MSRELWAEEHIHLIYAFDGTYRITCAEAGCNQRLTEDEIRKVTFGGDEE